MLVEIKEKYKEEFDELKKVKNVSLYPDDLFADFVADAVHHELRTVKDMLAKG